MTVASPARSYPAATLKSGSKGPKATWNRIAGGERDGRRRGGWGYAATVRHAWPEAVERVNAFLREAAAEARVEEFPAGSATAEEAADAVGCDLDHIVKSLLFECDGRPVLVLVSGDRRADKAKVAAAAGATSASVASPQRVTEITGFEPGAVAPFPLPRVEHVFLDRVLLVHERVWIGAGSSRHMAGLAPSERVRLARATPFDVTSED